MTIQGMDPIYNRTATSAILNDFFKDFLSHSVVFEEFHR